MQEELTDRYGEPPAEVVNLLAVSRLRRTAQKAGLSEVVVMGQNLRLAPADLPDSRQIRLRRMYPNARMMPQGAAILVPLPQVNGALPADPDLISWASELLRALFASEPAATPR